MSATAPAPLPSGDLPSGAADLAALSVARDRLGQALAQRIVGQQRVVEALLVGLFARGHVLLIGPPGSGKTMMARRVAGILPPLTLDEALEVTAVHSVAGLLPPGTGLVSLRPFRAPHHTISEAALVGASADATLATSPPIAFPSGSRVHSTTVRPSSRTPFAYQLAGVRP